MGATRLEAAEKCPTRDEAAEKTDAGRVAPISACVILQRLSDRTNLNPKVEYIRADA